MPRQKSQSQSLDDESRTNIDFLTAIKEILVRSNKHIVD